MKDTEKVKVMFVCLGNICRSPLAHAVFEDILEKEGLEDLLDVDSSGTGAWHVGEPADSRMRQTAGKHGVRINHYAQQLVSAHLDENDLILAMDRQNYKNILALCRSDEQRKKVKMFRDYDPEGSGDVPDPWYGGDEGFDMVWRIVYRTCVSLLSMLKADNTI